MKQSKAVMGIIANILVLLLLVSVPAVFAQAGGRGGGGGGAGGGGRAGGFGGGGIIGGSRSGSTVGEGARGGMIGSGGRSHPFLGPVHRQHFHHDHFFFDFGISAFVPVWWWYDPYYYYWGTPSYYPYYGDPYSNYYGYPYYWSDPCLSQDPASGPYCPPAADNPNYPGYSVPSVYYPSPAPPVQPESSYESQPPMRPQ
ncbi:MAG: hypothetical protein KGL31_01035 [candidate division NC10 bacterium]|nr:hypothetical protein [candidate division NC10 bacterium]MDE2320495.1 hypothetical protein [candidate division NC10 bacterium]